MKKNVPYNSGCVTRRVHLKSATPSRYPKMESKRKSSSRGTTRKECRKSGKIEASREEPFYKGNDWKNTDTPANQSKSGGFP